jgi:hypothetical protein
VHSDPLAAFRPVDKERRDMAVARFRSALDAVMRGASPDEHDWRLLADVVNLVETLADDMGKLPVDQAKPHLDSASEAMVAAARRWRAGQGMRLDAPGVQALRRVIDIYEQCLELLTERVMDQARERTQKRLERIWRHGAAPGQKVVMV